MTYRRLFIVAAILAVLVNFLLAGFAPYFMVLIPGFPFLLLLVLPASGKRVGDENTAGIMGAGMSYSQIWCTA
ncbi:hypothetical protein [Thiolapillus brandeum]|uniref:hypothetical protein n=1 Tax=Thiolapillus brandeum TaxID=1076588 RepID=UPI00059720B4|nr:hypothetical protein [Thiolapillus brandeum]